MRCRTDHSRSNSRLAELKCIVLFGIVPTAATIGLLVALLATGLTRAREDREQQFIAQQRALTPLLERDPAFGSVRIREFTGGGADLSGVVATEEDLQRLRGAVAATLGEPDAVRVLRGVEVAQTTADASTPNGSLLDVP